jgi:sulfatase maturation enzyme AslB (radical SAM superfamily)
MCNPVGSSMHETELKDWKTINVQLPSWINTIDKFQPEKPELKDFKGLSSENINFDVVIKHIEPMLPYCEEITLLGGEPFVHPMTEKILKLCIDKDIAKNITIEIITNLSIFNQHHSELFSKFKQSVIVVSYDHVDEDKFKYIRFPAPYEKFKRNFQVLMDTSVVKKISTTFSIFNIFDFEEIFDEFELVRSQLDEQLFININLVSTPEYFDIKYLEAEQKEQLSKRITEYLNNNKDYKIFQENIPLFEYLKTIREFSLVDNYKFNEVVKERTRVLDLYDVTRKTDYRKLFPFIKEYH